MKTVSVRELQQNIKHVIDQVEHGQVEELDMAWYAERGRAATARTRG
jgi:hypothetical protein